MSGRSERKERALGKRKNYASLITAAVEEASMSVKKIAEEAGKPVEQKDIDSKAFQVGEDKWNQLMKENRQEASLVVECLPLVEGEAKRVFVMKRPQFFKPPQQQQKKRRD